MAQLSTQLPWELARTRWPAQLNPILSNVLLAGNQLDDIVLTAGVPLAIDHFLSRMPQGWILIDNLANSQVWRSSPFTKFKITLTASADTTVSLWVF